MSTIEVGARVRIIEPCVLASKHDCQTGTVGIVQHDDAPLIGGIGYWVECEDGGIRGYLRKHLEAVTA